jgi:hypothetical protein
MIDIFCRGALDQHCDVAAGVAPGAVILETYPQAVRTFLRFREGRYSGANLFAFPTPDGLAAARFWRRIEQQRKKPWRIARALGYTTLLSYLLGRLTLSQAVARLSKIIGVKAAAVVLPIAEAAIDVDKPKDLDLVEEILRKRRGG